MGQAVYSDNLVLRVCCLSDVGCGFGRQGLYQFSESRPSAGMSRLSCGEKLGSDLESCIEAGS